MVSNTIKSLQLLTPKKTASLLQVSIRTLAWWRTKGIALRFVRVGKHVRYRQEDIEEFINNHLHEQ